MKHLTYDLGFVVENGEKRPLNEKERERDKIYSEQIIKSFIPKN